MAKFNFGTKPKAKKKSIRIHLTEEMISEDNPQLASLIDPAISAEKARLRNENKKDKLKQADFNQTHFYVCAVFQSMTQKLEFLDQIPDTPCIDDVFIDGEAFATAVGKPVTPNELLPIESPLNKKLSELAKIPRE